MIGRSPEWFPHQIDLATDRVVLLRMSEADYRAASFLDQRALRPGAEMRAVEWKALSDDVPLDARRDAQYIFHIGNAGSTLISRLLGELYWKLAVEGKSVAVGVVLGVRRVVTKHNTSK